MSGIPKFIALAVVALLSTMFAAAPAWAQTPSPFASWQNDSGVVLRSMKGPIKDWEVVLGGGVAAVPEYEGSKHYEVLPAPVFDIRYKDWAFLTDGEGLGVNLIHGPNYRAGVAVGYDLGRSQHDERILNGTGSIPPAPVVRAFGEFSLLPFVIKADIAQAIGGVGGIRGDVGLYAPIVGNEKLIVFVGPAVTLANERYMQRYFGIGTTQAIPNSRFPPFQAHAGFAHANFGVAAVYNITEHWLIDADLGYERLLASAADSPLAQSKNQLGASVTLDYEF